MPTARLTNVSGYAASKQVMALTVATAWTHRRARVAEAIRERFWPIPLLLVLAGVLVGVIVSRPERVWIAEWDTGQWAQPNTAETILQVMASSMLTFVGVVFAITLVGLQLASSQLSPRVIRTFVRSGVTKTAFGGFLAAFAFAITGIAFDDVGDPVTATRTVFAAVVILSITVVLFIVYVTQTMKLLEVGWVITAVANEARAAIAHGYPDASHYVAVSEPRREPEPAIVHLPRVGGRGYRGALGTVLGIDRARLIQFGTEHDCVIELIPRIGEYVPTGGRVFAVHGPGRPTDQDLVSCLHLGRVRTLYQDPTFGIRQLVDVATQALSPAVNQPTTAVLVIDRLHDLLLRISRQPAPTGMHADASGVVRLIEPTVSWDYVLDLCFDEISVCGAASWHVTRRLAAAYADLRTDCSDRDPGALAALQDNLERLARAKVSGAFDVRAITPDRLGLG